jgi:hypothetical protein
VFYYYRESETRAFYYPLSKSHSRTIIPESSKHHPSNKTREVRDPTATEKKANEEAGAATVESTEISVQDFLRLEPRVICDSYIAGIADLYVKGILRVQRRLPSTSRPEIFIDDYPRERTVVDGAQKDDEVREILRKLSLVGIITTETRTDHRTNLNEPRTPTASRPSQPNQAVTANMVNVSIKAFRGLKDGTENVKDFLADVEFAAKAFDKPAETTDETRIVLFRQNLQDYAIKWWNLDVSDEQKEEWATIKDLFLSKFGFGTTANEKLFALQRDIINLKQGENESISSYTDRAKMISKRDSGSLGNLLAMNFVQGMRDDFHKDRVEYSMGLEKNPVTFNTVLEFVKVSYKRLGKEDPFDEGAMAAQAIANPPYLIPSQHRIPITAAVQPAPRQPT